MNVPPGAGSHAQDPGPAREAPRRSRTGCGKTGHTIAFFHLVLGEIKEALSWDEAEFLAGLALLCVEAMSQRQQITQAADHDLKAEVWTAVANVPRPRSRWWAAGKPEGELSIR